MIDVKCNSVCFNTLKQFFSFSSIEKRIQLLKATIIHSFILHSHKFDKTIVKIKCTMSFFIMMFLYTIEFKGKQAYRLFEVGSEK